MGNEECYSSFDKRVCTFISGKSSMTHWKLRATREERESVKNPNNPEGFWFEKRWGQGEKGEGRLGVR